MSHPFFGTAHLRLDLWHRKTTHLVKRNAREHMPDPFVRIPFWRRSRQALQRNPPGTPVRESVFDRLAAMNGGSIPDDQPCARDCSREHRHTANHVWPCGGVVVHLQEDPAFWRNAAQSRTMVTGPRDGEDRCLASGRRGAYRHWHQGKGGRIDTHARALFLFRRVVSAGHRSAFQVAMAVSSRWLACGMGWCRACFTGRRRRRPWAG